MKGVENMLDEKEILQNIAVFGPLPIISPNNGAASRSGSGCIKMMRLQPLFLSCSCF
jgi:hypothetical protein